MNYTTFFFYSWYFHAHVLSFNTDEQQTKIFLHSKTENAFQKNVEKNYILTVTELAHESWISINLILQSNSDWISNFQKFIE